MRTIKELTELYQSVYFLPDEGIIPLICSIVISNKMPGDAVWLMIVGPSSGGKSELINTILGVKHSGGTTDTPFVHQISTLTSNAFLSGAGGQGRETSLLKKIGLSGVIAMKDFTSILSLGKETQVAVMGQLREIYDGHLVKETGTGKKLQWGPGGKLNLIAGTTEGIYLVEQEFSTLGPRWINYVLKEQDPTETAKVALKNENRIAEIRAMTKTAFSEYIEYMIANVPQEEIHLSEEFEHSLIELCSFVSIARSPVTRNYRGEMIFAISSEMPMRMVKQCSTIAKTLFYMNGMEESKEYDEIVYKVALDSVPKEKMVALEALTQFRSITTAGLAAKIKYPTATVKTWLEDLNVRGLCDRNKHKMTNAGSQGTGGSTGDHWTLDVKYRALLEKFKGIKMIDEELVSKDALDDEPEEISRGWRGPKFDKNDDTDEANRQQEEAAREDMFGVDFGAFN